MFRECGSGEACTRVRSHWPLAMDIGRHLAALSTAAGLIGTDVARGGGGGGTVAWLAARRVRCRLADM